MNGDAARNGFEPAARRFAGPAPQRLRARATRLQQALCFVRILHALILTDFVGYQHGRGVANPWADWFHWLEVFVWRIAILLPVYQKLATDSGGGPTASGRRKSWKRSGAWGRIRTTDTRIFNPLLYQLSYPGRGRRREEPRL